MSALYDAALKFRREVEAYEAAAADRLTAAYAHAWRDIRQQLEQLQREIRQAREAGEEVNAGWLFRQERLQRLQAQAEERVAAWVPHANEAIRTAQEQAVNAALGHTANLTQLAFANTPAEALAAVNFARLNAGAVQDLVGFASNGSPLRTLLDKLPASAGASVEKRLVAAVATSQNPRVTASLIREDLGGDLTRAQRIARTETFRAYRESSRRSYAANEQLYTGWVWVAALQARTCAACLAMHGTLHPFTETLNGHVNCRCTMLPRRKSLAELGYPGIPDSRLELETGPEWFARQPVEMQARILGAKGQAAYAAGDVTLEDFVGVHHSAEWGSQRYERSLKGALAAAA